MVEQHEIAKHTYDNAWKYDSNFTNYERNRLLAALENDSKGRGCKLLDVGCGNGSVSEFFAGLGYDVTGIDISDTGIDRAKKRCSGTFIQGDVSNGLPFDNESFDVVFWGDNVEHLLAPVAVLLEIKRILRPGGRLLVSCPNTGHWWARLYYLIKGAMPRNEGHVNPPWQWEHLRFFTPSTLRKFLLSGGFNVTHMHGTHSSKFQSIIARKWPSMFATILLAEAKPIK